MSYRFSVHTIASRLPADRSRRAVDGLRGHLGDADSHRPRARPTTDSQRIEAAIDSADRLKRPVSATHRAGTPAGDACGAQGRWGCRLIERPGRRQRWALATRAPILADRPRSGHPAPATQVIHRHGSRFVARVDFLFGADVVVEVSGQHGHSSPSERRKDAQRRSELIEMGRLVYEHTYADVFETPQKVVRDLRRRLTSRLCPTS